MNDADETRIYFGNYSGSKSKRYRMMSLVSDLPLIENAIKKIGNVKMVIVDPIDSYLGVPRKGAINPNKSQEVAGLLNPIDELCQKYGVTFLIIMHINKAQDLGGIYRVSGSMRWTALGRAVLLIDRHKDYEQVRLFTVIKVNWTQELWSTLKFAWKIEQDRVQIVRDVEVPDAEEALTPESPKEKLSKQKIAQSFIKRFIGDRDEVSAAEAIAAAKREGITEGTLLLARSALGVVSVQTGSGWIWRYADLKK